MAKHPKRLSALLLSSYLVLVKIFLGLTPLANPRNAFLICSYGQLIDDPRQPLGVRYFSFERLIPRLPAAPVDIPTFVIYCSRSAVKDYSQA